MKNEIISSDHTSNHKHSGDYDCIEVDEKEEIDAKPKIKMTNLKFRFIKTFVLFLCWLSLGLSAEVIGPAMPLLEVLTNTNIEQIGRALAVRGFSMLFGAIVFGILTDKMRNKRNFFMLIIIWLMAISVVSISYCQNLWSLAIVFFISGFAHGSQDTAGNPCLASIWNHKSTGPFSFMHAGYGLGASVAPLLFKSFVTINTTTNQNRTITNSNNTVALNSQSYKYPFFIISCFGLLIGSIFIIYILIKDPIEQMKDKTNDDDNKQRRNKRSSEKLCCNEFVTYLKRKVVNVDRHKIVMVILIYLSYVVIVGVHFMFGNFLYSYAINSKLKMTPSKGYTINSIYWIGYCLSRIVNALIAIRVQPFLLYTLQCLISLVLTILFTIYDANELFFMVFCAGFVTVMSPLYPTMLGYINCHIEVTGALVMVISFGLSTGAMISQYMAAYFIYYVGYHTFPWMLLMFISFLNVLNFIMYFVFKPRIF